MICLKLVLKKESFFPVHPFITIYIIAALTQISPPYYFPNSQYLPYGVLLMTSTTEAAF